MNTIFKLTALTLGVPAALTATYLICLDRTVSRQVTTETWLRNNRSQTSIHARPPKCIPGEDPDSDSKCILAFERVASHPVALSQLRDELLSLTLTRYIRATMTAFGKTPQVFLIRRMMPSNDPSIAGSFSREKIQRLEFMDGDRVHGVWRVGYRGQWMERNQDGEEFGQSKEEERVELVIEPPPGYSGPVVEGVVVVAVQRVDESHVRFVNETWMWRRPKQNKLLLESSAGRWFHTLLSSWLVTKGVLEVARPGSGEKEE